MSDSGKGGKRDEHCVLRDSHSAPESGSSDTLDSFIPFGPEWEKMMMRKPKLEIVKMLKIALMQNAGTQVSARSGDNLK